MPAPVIYTPATGSTSSAATSHSVTLPASINAGELMVIVFQNFDDAITSSLSGWTQDHTHEYDLATPTLRITQFSKTAVGGETSVSVTTSSSTTASWIAYRINDGAIGQLSTSSKGVSSAPNPADFPLPESFSDDVYLIVVAGWENDVSLSSYPATYGSGVAARVTGTDGSGIAAAFKLTTSTEDAGAFALSGSGNWIAYNQVIEYLAGPPSPMIGILEVGTLTLSGKVLLAGALNFDLDIGQLFLDGGDAISFIQDPTILDHGTLSLFGNTSLGCLRLEADRITKIDMSTAIFDLCALPPLSATEGQYFGCVLVGASGTSRVVNFGFTSLPVPANLVAKGDIAVWRVIAAEYYLYNHLVT